MEAVRLFCYKENLANYTLTGKTLDEKHPATRPKVFE